MLLQHRGVVISTTNHPQPLCFCFTLTFQEPYNEKKTTAILKEQKAQESGIAAVRAQGCNHISWSQEQQSAGKLKYIVGPFFCAPARSGQMLQTITECLTRNKENILPSKTIIVAFIWTQTFSFSKITDVWIETTTDKALNGHRI